MKKEGSLLLVEFVVIFHGDNAGVDSFTSMEKLPTEGSEWVNVLVNEMTHASNMDDAKTRASKVLELLEKNISERANADAIQRFQEVSILFEINDPSFSNSPENCKIATSFCVPISRVILSTI